jgi:hypothetical protein
MAITIYRHDGYDLHCSAKPTDRGTYAPELVVCKSVWPTRPRTIQVDRGTHESEAAAIEAARAQGVEWVTNFG